MASVQIINLCSKINYVLVLFTDMMFKKLGMTQQTRERKKEKEKEKEKDKEREGKTKG